MIDAYCDLTVPIKVHGQEIGEFDVRVGVEVTCTWVERRVISPPSNRPSGKIREMFLLLTKPVGEFRQTQEDIPDWLQAQVDAYLETDIAAAYIVEAIEDGDRRRYG